MHSYTLYGLAVESTVALPGAPSSEFADPNVRVREGSIDRSWVDRSADLGHVRTTGDVATFVYDDVALAVRGGREVVLDPSPGATADLLAFYVLGKALAVALHQRGYLVLHASAAVVDGRTVVVLGEPGAGKSTVAAAAHVRGHPVLADDVTPVDLAGTPTIRPGFPALKLDPDTAVTLGAGGGDAFGSPVADPSSMDKALYPLCGDGSARFDPGGEYELDGVYVLARGEAAEVASLSPGEAVTELVRHTYAAYLLDDDGRETNFRQCADLARAVPVRRLYRSADGDRRATVAAVEADLAARDR